MSLINQMLQDLDKRGAEVFPAEPMHSHIRPAVTATRSGWFWRWSVLAVAALLVAALVLWLNWRPLATPILPGNANPRQISATSTPMATSAVVTSLDVQQTALAASGSTVPLLDDLPMLLKLSSSLERSAVAASASVIATNDQQKPASSNISAASVAAANPATVLALSAKPAEKNALVFSDKAEKADKADKSKVIAALKDGTAPDQANPGKSVNKEITPVQLAESYYRQASVLQQQGRPNEATLILEQALKADATHGASRQSLIALLLESKRHDEAARVAQQGLALDQNQTGLAMILARLQVEKGNTPLAIETLQRSLPAATERADYLAFLAALQQRQGLHKEAADLYQRALRKNPQNGLWWMGLGISLQSDGRSQDALEAFHKAKSATGLSPELLAFVEQKISLLQR
ncbi:hypothetical protein BH11PSE12_BH11PSE12_13270 [soil metagenome]